ncbi:hypothetical protein X947_5627 [Burkholderia pseudomallei MSHR7334]|nr:hypothetical protein X947_5627 [Burkholderia pseudomallei MSHR7334]
MSDRAHSSAGPRRGVGMRVGVGHHPSSAIAYRSW